MCACVCLPEQRLFPLLQLTAFRPSLKICWYLTLCSLKEKYRKCRHWHTPGMWFMSSIWGISSVQLLSHVQLFATPWIAGHQASLSITNSWSSLRFTSIESVMPSSHLILSSPSPPAPNPSQHQSLFQWVSSSHELAKVLEFQLQYHSFQRIPGTDIP